MHLAISAPAWAIGSAALAGSGWRLPALRRGICLRLEPVGDRIAVELGYRLDRKREGDPQDRTCLVPDLDRQVSFARARQPRTGNLHESYGFTIDERVARGLLLIHDRIDGDDISITHDTLAQILGVRRPGVTLSTHILEGCGLIRAKRGQIRILNRSGLERAANGCYGQAHMAAWSGTSVSEPVVALASVQGQRSRAEARGVDTSAAREVGALSPLIPRQS